MFSINGSTGSLKVKDNYDNASWTYSISDFKSTGDNFSFILRPDDKDEFHWEFANVNGVMKGNDSFTMTASIEGKKPEINNGVRIK